MFVSIPKTGSSSIANALFGSQLEQRSMKVRKHAFLRNMPDEIKDQFIFSFVRNPWDHAYSMFRSHRNFNQITFKTFLSDHIHRTNWMEQNKCSEFSGFHNWLVDHDGRMPDFIGRFESLEADFKYVCNYLEIETELEHRNPSKHPNNYRDAYKSQELIDRVADLYSKDIRYFGYDF